MATYNPYGRPEPPTVGTPEFNPYGNKPVRPLGVPGVHYSRTGSNQAPGTTVATKRPEGGERSTGPGGTPRGVWGTAPGTPNTQMPDTGTGTIPGGGDVPASGSQSGPGILENWFNQRAMGTDPAYEYAMDRGMDAIDTRMAAGGSYNSGARGQQLSDFGANMGAQRMGQLDSLAGGASGEHLGRLGLMFNQGLSLAGGQSGLASAYDLGAAGNMDAANRARTTMELNKAGVDSQFASGRLNSLINAYSAYNSGTK